MPQNKQGTLLLPLFLITVFIFFLLLVLSDCVTKRDMMEDGLAFCHLHVGGSLPRLHFLRP